MKRLPKPPDSILEILKNGVVIPAHPLALSSKRKLDEKRQAALTRYYLAAGSGGIAVGVHTTQFEIHNPKVGLYQPVLEIAAETMKKFQPGKKPVIKIAGICGKTKQALKEARIAGNLGYHAGLLSLSTFKNASLRELITHCRTVSTVIPLFGFYLQPKAGGRILGIDFWRRFMEIENVIGIKIAPFNRYLTLDVVRALAESGREKEIALYTGNDDSIVHDLLTCFAFGKKEIRIVGGLLGHWAFWTKRAVELLEEIRKVSAQNIIPSKLLDKGQQITDCNGAVFDAKHIFRGCIPGINEVLKRQGLMEGNWCLNPKEVLSRGQAEEIDRIYSNYPHLNDDGFVARHCEEWLK